MITTVAVSPYARYGLPTVTTWPAAAAMIGVYIGRGMSMPLWKPPQRAPKGELIGCGVSGQIESLAPLKAPRPERAAAAAASCAYIASASSSFLLSAAVSALAAFAFAIWLFR